MNLTSVSERLTAAVCAVLLWSVATVAAQTTAMITGSVVDQSGGAVAGATVTVTSSAGTTLTKTTTDATGAFSVRDVRPGHYRVQIEQKLFATVQVDVEVVDGAAPAPIRAVLQVSGLTEAVDVEAPGLYTVRNSTTATKTDAPLFDTPVAVSVVPILRDYEDAAVCSAP